MGVPLLGVLPNEPRAAAHALSHEELLAVVDVGDRKKPPHHAYDGIFVRLDVVLDLRRQFVRRGEDHVRQARLAAGVAPTFKTVDTCAAEFEAETPYYYSCYETESG